MTATAEPTTAPGARPPVETITATIDGISVTVPKGTLIIRAAELIGILIPRFCDHPLLEPVAMCRQCLVEVAPGPPKPQPACAVALADGMTVKTQHTSEMAAAAQRGVMEFILANHPLDCPVCDKGGECPLQNQAMQVGRGESRYTLPKVSFEKPIPVSAQVLLDRERCVNCARCTRFADQIAGDPFIALLERGGKQQVGINPGYPFDSYFSGNTVQICPVGALTSAKYRFRARPFDLVSTPTVCEHCASGCALRTDSRRGVVTRRLAWDDYEVNEEWNCDKGRFAFPYLTEGRLTAPLVRGADGELHTASWPEAIEAAAAGLASARGRAGVLTGGRLTLEDALAYSAFARTVLATDHVDFRARAASGEEAAFLAAQVAGTGLGVTYGQLEAAPSVLLVAFEPEEESPITFLRMRKAVKLGRQQVTSIAPWRSNGLRKLAGTLVATAPGDEVAALTDAAVASALATPGAVILVGERAAAVPGLLSAVAALAQSTGASLAWIPRRAGERAALDAGLLPGLLPGGRPLADPQARAQLAAAFGVPTDALPAAPGLDGPGMLAAVADDVLHRAQAEADGTLEEHVDTIAAFVVAGVDPDDLPDPAALRLALSSAGFVVSLEQRLTDVAAHADVVLPVAAVSEKPGTFVDWEGRERPFGQVFHSATTMSDARVLALVADAMSVLVDEPLSTLHRGGTLELRDAWRGLSGFTGQRYGAPAVAPAAPGGALPAGAARLATWRQLVDLGTMQHGEPFLAATAPDPVARVSPGTAERLGIADGHVLAVQGPAGSVHLEVALTPMPDDVVWLPGNSVGCRVGPDLGAGWGDVVALSVVADTAISPAGDEA
jgi:NADH-quinone oxidoreductase subunit G